jgi:hypothetical protein
VKHTETDIILYAAVLTYYGMEDFDGADEFYNILLRAGMNPSYNYSIYEFNDIIANLVKESE